MEKKFLFIGMAAAVMLTGCSNDETMDVAQNKAAIEFSGFVNKSVRGAADDFVTDKLLSFHVSSRQKTAEGAVSEARERTVARENAQSDWAYNPLMYWEDGSNYSFVAYAPEKANVVFTAGNEFEEETTPAKIDFTNDGVTDLIYGVDNSYITTPVEHVETGHAPVSFTFNHLLSRVKFEFTNALEDKSELKVTNVTITNANSKGVATLAETATWAVSEGNAATSLSFGNAPMEEAEEATFGPTESAATDHMYMIPLACPDNGQYTVTFTIERDYEGLKDTYEHSVKIPASVTLAAGNSYCFTAEINAENITGGGEDNPPLCPIEFTVSEVKGWTDFNATPVEFPSTGEEGTQGE